ncbi:hypothetical protein C8R48DRAFT_688567 [Suillus tomentosus]|nr:hypothetical protein C8R48DRAFT_688567 [Suillus tomentosus]
MRRLCKLALCTPERVRAPCACAIVATDLHDDTPIPRPYSQNISQMAFMAFSPLYEFIICFVVFTPSICYMPFKAHNQEGTFPKPLGMDILKEDLYACSSLLPAGEIQEVAREPPSPSDFPYGTSPRPSRCIVRDNTSRSLPEATIGYPDAVGTNSHESRSSLILSVGESPTRYYATYTKRVRARRVTTIYNSVANVHRRSTDPIAVPLDLSNQTTPVSDPVIGGHNIASPCSDERLGPEQVGPDDGPPIGLLVAEEVGRCEKYTPRSVAIISYINRIAGLKLLKGVLYRPKSLFLP